MDKQIDKIINELKRHEKKHTLNDYVYKIKKDYFRSLINNELDEYQIYMYDNKLLDNKEFIKRATKKIKSIFKYVDEIYYYDYNLVRYVLNKGFSYKNVLIKLIEIYKDDYSMIKRIIRNNGTLYKYLSDDFKNDLDIIKLSIRHSWNDNIYSILDDKYKNNKELILQAIKYSKGHHIYDLIPDNYKLDENIINETLKNNGWGIRLFGEDITGNKEIVIKAVSNNGYALKFATNELRNDFDIVMSAIKNNPLAIKFASDEMKELIKIV